MIARSSHFFLIAAGTLAAATLPWIESQNGAVEHDKTGQISSVTLRASWITDGDLLDLARLPNLERLDLSRTRITDQGLSYLKSAIKLREVDLSYAEKIGDPAHAVIKHWKNLRRLNLRGTVVADETAAAAAALPELEVLDIADTIVGDNGMEALGRAQKLKELSIGNIRMSEAGFQSLRQFTTLVSLDISGKRHGGRSNVTDRAIEAIGSLRGLRALKLGHLTFTDKSFAAIAALPALERLGLEFCPGLEDAALKQLAAAKSLRWVDLHGTKVTAAGVAALRQERPDMQVLWE
jgi:Leucine-rich repeat (LRR) protein